MRYSAAKAAILRGVSVVGFRSATETPLTLRPLRVFVTGRILSRVARHEEHDRIMVAKMLL